MSLKEKEVHFWLREDNESPEQLKKRALNVTSAFGYRVEDVDEAVAELKKSCIDGSDIVNVKRFESGNVFFLRVGCEEVEEGVTDFFEEQGNFKDYYLIKKDKFKEVFE